jgi:hypothetical protein
MSRIRTKTGESCICCGESTSARVILHKTRRQTHSLCSICAEGYLGPLLESSIRNIKKKIWTANTLKLKCPGSYCGVLRNQCKHEVDIRTLNFNHDFNHDSNVLTNILRILHILTHKDSLLCPTLDCQNIIRIHPQDSIRHTSCENCRATWCRNCMAQPYHEDMSCLEYEASLSNTENGKLIAKLFNDGVLKLCPQCRVPITKQQDGQGIDLGCNKIICSSCEVKWCWLCGETNIGYEHFNSQGVNACARRLWEGTAQQPIEN